MDWIDFSREGTYVVFRAVLPDGLLSSECADPVEVDGAARTLKHQIDIAANRMKMALQGKVELFPDA